MGGADFQQQQELERERWERTIEALDRAQELGLEPEHIRFLARECGISNYQTRKESHAAHE